MKKLSKQEFIERAKQIHGDKYNYSKVEYVNNRTKVCIICPEHGEFYQKPEIHLMGCGCSICKSEKIKKDKTTPFENFVESANKIHNNIIFVYFIFSLFGDEVILLLSTYFLKLLGMLA